MTDKRIYQIGLTMINGVGDILARHLLESLGDEEAIFTEKKSQLEKITGIGPTLSTEILRADVLQKAEKELTFIEKNKIDCHFYTDSSYPHRLKQCEDAPILFYSKGNIKPDVQRVISVVGTRNATTYGKDLTESLIRDLALHFPDLLVLSGLAYGIDICAHRSALQNQLPTIGVLAHGLDRIYPAIHRNTAVEMLQQGGLITDFPSGTNPDKQNFIKRNRIVAGLSDATLVVESSSKGGSLITADIAFSYGRDVYCFPGRVADEQSKGCNKLIRENKAGLITCAADLIAALRWESNESPSTHVQHSLAFEEENAHPIVILLKEKGELHVNQMAIALNIPIRNLTTQLFELEMEGKIKTMPGGMFRLVR